MAIQMLESSISSISLSVSDEPSDVELMRQLALGKSVAMRELMRRHQKWVFGIGWRMTGDAAAAEDLVQETFLRLYQSASRFKPEAKLSTYIRRIIVNLAIDYRRAAKPIMKLSDEGPEPAAEERPDTLEAMERQQRVQKAIAQLPARQRMALTLHRFENLSYREIAEAMELTESAVESLVMRAYGALRKSLADLCEDRTKE